MEKERKEKERRTGNRTREEGDKAIDTVGLEGEDEERWGATEEAKGSG